MKLKELEGYLQQVEGFDQPKLHLEQYITSGHIASHMLFSMDQTYDDIENNIVADFGCGCGVLSIGAGMLGAGQVIGIDIDQDALDIAQENISSFELESEIDLINCNLASGGENRVLDYLASRKTIDTVIMNPPFGTKDNKGIDLLFLKNAIDISQGAVYSLHKTTTRNFISKKVDEWGCSFEVLAELRYDLPKTYKFHKKQSLDVYVDFIRCEKN